MKEIRLQDIEGFRIGSAENQEAGTGCTVIICPEGAPCGVDIRGGGPASRESELLNPLAAASQIHAVLLSGGSAYGLDAAGGVMRYLEEQGIGLQVAGAIVPLVVEACIFDLEYGKNIRPDATMGYEACKNAETNPPIVEGSHGVGTGATVGKLFGDAFMTKAGLGTFAVELGDLQVGAIVAVNALGDVLDEQGQILAGMYDRQKECFLDTRRIVLNDYEKINTLLQNSQGGTTNTTIGAVIVNAHFNKSEMTKIAAMASNGVVRSICPVNTTADGDSIFALSVGNVEANLDLVGTIAAYAMEQAIRRAVIKADGRFGVPTLEDIKNN